MKKKKLKQTNASAHLIQYRFKIREDSPENILATSARQLDLIPPYIGYRKH